MARIQSICVYCGSSNNVSPAHLDAATRLGTLAAEKSIEVVYGGGRVGSMGRVADGALNVGGRVTGIIPEYLQRWEVGHNDVSEFIVVDSMHTRKMQMFEKSDAFCILPGGLGTLDEFFEIATWKQLGMHDKPILLINLEQFWTPLLDLVKHQIECGYLRQDPAQIFQVVDSVEDVFATLSRLPEPHLETDSSKL